MRTCHFTMNKQQKRSFYLTIVRSIFEHCSIIWCPQNSTQLSKFVTIQKRAIKWINGHQFERYTEEVFHENQRDLKILPINFKFLYNDLTLFFKIVNVLVHITLPNYITVAEADRVRYTRQTAAIVDYVDVTTFRCDIVPNCDCFRNSYFYRTMLHWNKLPVSVRQVGGIASFKSALTEFLWSADTSWPD